MAWENENEQLASELDSTLRELDGVLLENQVSRPRALVVVARG
jgi:hypothetical protein